MDEKKGLFERFKRSSKKEKKKNKIIKEFRIAYRAIENLEYYFKRILLPILLLGILVFFLPTIFNLLSLPLAAAPFLFPFGGSIIIILGILYPYITWKNKEVEINESMHFFITHLRV